jgi:hypothetical protein
MMGTRMNKLAGWLAMALLAGCNPMMEDKDVEPDEPVAAQVGALTSNTQADLTFSESGQGRLFAPTNAMWINAVTDAGGGKVAFTSGAWNGDVSRYDGIVNRVNNDGSRDTTWNPGDPGHDHVLNDELVAGNTAPVAIQVIGGKTYVAGSIAVGAGQRAFIAALKSNGELDESFNASTVPHCTSCNGFIKPHPVGYDSFAITRLFVDTSVAGHARLVIVGTASKTVSGTLKRYAAAARFDAATGVWDEGYGASGWAIRETGGGSVVAGQGKGRADLIVASNNKVFRFDGNGDFDAVYGPDALHGVLTYREIIDIAVTPGGQAYLLSQVGGTESTDPVEQNRYGWSSYHRLIALRSNGFKNDDFAWDTTPVPTPDNDCNICGPAGPAPPQWWDEPGRADLSSEGTFRAQRVEYNERLNRIYVLGNVLVGEDPIKRYWGTLAFRINGQYDESFGSHGRLYTDFVKIDGEVAYDMALQTYGNAEKILMSGQGTMEKKGPLARVVIDWGHNGEPCRNRVCATGFTCKDEATAPFGPITSATCRAD